MNQLREDLGRSREEAVIDPTMMTDITIGLIEEIDVFHHLALIVLRIDAEEQEDHKAEAGMHEEEQRRSIKEEGPQTLTGEDLLVIYQGPDLVRRNI